jgi:hypothetical protein
MTVKCKVINGPLWVRQLNRKVEIGEVVELDLTHTSPDLFANGFLSVIEDEPKVAEKPLIWPKLDQEE